MFDFESLPTFTDRTVLWRRAGVRFHLVSVAVNWLLLYGLMVGLFPWLNVLAGLTDLRQIGELTWNHASTWYTLLPTCAAVGYIAFATFQLSRLRRRDPDYALFTDSGSRLLSRGDILSRRIRRMKANAAYFYKRHPRDPSAPFTPGSFEEWSERRFTKEWFAIRKAAWDLHNDQQSFRASIPLRA